MTDLKRWATADWHLGEDRFKLMQRLGFADAQAMIDHLVECHNSVVSPGDIVYMVGDVCNQKTPEFLSQAKRFNGRKMLLRGNHDRVFTDEQLEPYFVRIIDEGEGEKLVVEDADGNDIECWLTHYPTQARPDMFNLVGHIHGAWKFQLNALNVGVDANHYYPHNIDEDVPFYLRAISEFYDEDVWVAYHEAQEAFRGKRGKKGRYLDVQGLVGGGRPSDA
jgi:calcineurin-like phosphoesterase family protein